MRDLPLHQRRGIDARQRDYSWTAIQVRAPLEVVARGLATYEGFKLLAEAANPASKIVVADAAELVMCFQLHGHPWTLLERPYGRLFADLAARLSQTCSTLALAFMYEDVAGVFGYQLFERGDTVEEFYLGAPDSAENREFYLANGWQISDDGNCTFRSQRPDVTDARAFINGDWSDHRAKQLDLYLPFDVWSVECDNAPLCLRPDWKATDLVGAVAFHVTE